MGLYAEYFQRDIPNLQLELNHTLRFKIPLFVDYFKSYI